MPPKPPPTITGRIPRRSSMFVLRLPPRQSISVPPARQATELHGFSSGLLGAIFLPETMREESPLFPAESIHHDVEQFRIGKETADALCFRAACGDDNLFAWVIILAAEVFQADAVQVGAEIGGGRGRNQRFILTTSIDTKVVRVIGSEQYQRIAIQPL